MIETAKAVFLSMLRIFSCGRMNFLSSLNFGAGGYSSAPSPRILKKEGPDRTVETFLSSTSSSISDWDNSRTMPKIFLTGNVVAPPVLTSAVTELVIVTSRSVAVNSRRLPSARNKTFDRIGNVVRVLTIFCTAWRPVSSCSLAMVKFI